ncbi:SDR family NAD(P)-dependent oxidoreductase [Agrococcus baldri]|uniref:3-oxoacyl-ACP reductase n=1 Tax=Agrococcus baldri TaxID=153730 RepID=A0AA87RJ53_9MICO|nr:SDR family oxidoreductase [Agrococcus baldri]GEK79152.1 3-oxoacyl-ACP reductase [Agrococcus baldri]
MHHELAGKTVIVTGGAQGIGHAIAELMAQEGARVVVADVKEDQGRAVSAAIGADFVRTDVSDVDDVERLVAHAISEHGGLDVVVNNAGITKFVDFFEIEDEHWDRVQAVNVRSMFFLMRAGARHMKDHGGGAFVNISSMAAKGYRHTSSAAYASSKGGVLGLTRAGAMQLARYGIRVNAICPGIVLSPLNEQWVAEHPEYIGEIPLGIPSLPADIAAAAVFLASDRSRTITAQSLNVDGGLTID